MITLDSFVVDNLFLFVFTKVFISAKCIKLNIHKSVGSPVFIQIEAKPGRLKEHMKRIMDDGYEIYVKKCRFTFSSLSLRDGQQRKQGSVPCK